jgi:ATP-binding cassette subfamily F protein uup
MFRRTRASPPASPSARCLRTLSPPPRSTKSEREGRLRELTGRAGFADLNAEAASLSGGWRKRLAITEAMVIEPEVMLLDEPTNHLDLAGIEWLEELLRASPSPPSPSATTAIFLESTSSQIVELNRVFADGLFRVKGTFSRFLEEKQAYLESQSKQQESLRNRSRPRSNGCAAAPRPAPPSPRPASIPPMR